jgi:hypothetical protein
MARAAHADTVADRYGLPSYTASGTFRSGFAARLHPVVQWVGSPLDNASTTRPTSWPALPYCNFFKRCLLTSDFAKPWTFLSRS